MIGDKIVFVIHEPHRKDDYVGKYDHHNILDLLRLNGLMENEEEKE
jgi:hypothetical protein